MDKPLPFAFQKALHGDARRARYHAGDITRRNALAEHSTVVIALCGDLALEIGNCGVAQARRGLVITLALCNLKLMLGLFETALALFVALQPLALCPYIRYDCSCGSLGESHVPACHRSSSAAASFRVRSRACSSASRRSVLRGSDSFRRLVSSICIVMTA